MNTKNRFKHILTVCSVCCAIAATLAGCEMKEDDLFSVDPANRSDQWMAEYRRVFNNNEYGWALYTDNPTYGRHPAVYTYAVKFDQTWCTFYQSSSTKSLPVDRDKDSVQSMYSFKMDNGIVLSFDTYNSFFHYYADNSQYFAQDLQGDFEFCLDRYSENEDTIFGRGKTKQLPFVMIKMPCPAPEYQTETDKITSLYSPYDCVFICEGDTLTARFLSGYHNLMIWFPEDNINGDGHLFSYGNLIRGIYFLEPIEYKGKIIREMALNDEEDGYHDIHGLGSLAPRPFADYFTKDTEYDNYFFGSSGLSGRFAEACNNMKTALNKSSYKASTINNITFMPDGEGTLTLCVNVWYGDGEIHFPFDIKKTDRNQIALRWQGTEHSGSNLNIYKKGFSHFVDAIATKDEWRTYNITQDGGSLMSPGVFQLEDVDNPENHIYFEKNYRYYHDFWGTY